MKKALMLTLAVTAIAAAAPAAGIRWSKTLALAFSEAKSSHKIVMIDFYTDWCGWCKKLDAETYPDQKVVAEADQVVSVRVNAEKEGVNAATRYGIHLFPTIIFTDADGNVLYKSEGYRPPDAFVEQMKLGVQSGHLPDYLAKVKANPKDVDAIATVVSIYGSRNDLTKALNWLDRTKKADPANATGKIAVAYNAVGDMYQTANQFDTALAYFRKAERQAKSGHVAGYALISQAACYKSKQDQPNMAAALNRLKALGSAAKEYDADAQQLLQPAGG